MVNISTAVFTHPKRATQVKELLYQLPSNTRLIIDSYSEGHSRTGFRAWQSYDDTCTHHLVMEDDLILSKDFIQSVEKVVEAYPNQLISFFHIKNIQSEYLANNIHFVNMKRISWNQAILLPINLVKELSDFVGDSGYYKWADDFLTEFCMSMNIKMGITIPSLVQHKLPRNSIVGNPPTLGRKERTSPVFIGEDNSGTKINWHNYKNVLI